MPTELLELSSESADVQRRAFVVVGMHRSGTSAMTRVLSLLGAALPARVTEPRDDNETGFWEPWPIALLNDEILEALDSEWDDVFAFRPKRYLSNFDRVYLGRAVDLLEQEFSGSELIVLKDPRISVLTSFWERALREAGYVTHYIVMVRNPLEVAESLRARDGFPREKSFLLWSSYMLAIDRDTRDHERTFVSYDQLIGDWRGVRRRIETAGVPFPRDTAAAALQIDRFLDRRMHHHSAAAKDLFSSPDVPEQVKILYRIFSDACEGADVDSAALKAIQAEMEKLDLLVGPLLADLRGSARALSSKVAELADAHAGASERANLLEEQLGAERGLREVEAAEASKSNADYEARLTELVGRIAATEGERDRLAVAVEEKARSASELIEKLAQLESERIRLFEKIKGNARAAAELGEHLAAAEARAAGKQAELTAAQELLSSARAELAANKDQLARQFEEVVTLTELLKKSEREIELVKRDADAARKSADAEAKASEDKLARQFQESATLTERLNKSEREIELVKRDTEKARKNAEAAAKASEGKLAQRFREMATLTELLRQQEERGGEADKQVSWLLALNGRLAKQPRWWSLLPKSWGRRRILKRLHDAGLFDGEAYLRRYPDVAAARRDPLDHYLEHGYLEGRLRKS